MVEATFEDALLVEPVELEWVLVVVVEEDVNGREAIVGMPLTMLLKAPTTPPRPAEVVVATGVAALTAGPLVLFQLVVHLCT